MALSPSVVVNGVDLREAFGIEILRVEGRDSVKLDRREQDAPLRSGVVTQGGVYRAGEIRISGWVTAASADALAEVRGEILRFLTTDQTVPSKSWRSGTIQFADRPELAYRWDTVDSVRFTPQTGRWVVDLYYDVEIIFTITDAYPVRMDPAQYGIGWSDRYAGFTGAASAPEFRILSNTTGKSGATMRRGNLAILGPSTNPAISSSEMSAVFGFDGTLTGKDVEGADVTGVIHGYQGTTLITDGDMESSGVGSWTQTNATATKVSQVDDTTTNTRRVPQGTQAMKVVVSAPGGGVSQSISVTNGVEYRVSFWLFISTTSGYTDVTLNLTTFSTSTLNMVKSQWRLVEFVWRSTTTGSVTFAMTGTTNDTFWIDDVVVAPTLISNGTFYDAFGVGNPTGWSSSGTVVIAQETGASNVWGSANSLDVTFNSTGTMTSPSFSVVAGKVYHVCFRAKLHASSTAGRLRFHVTGATDMGGGHLSSEVVSDAMGRFSFHLYAPSNGTASLNFSATAVGFRVYLDAVSVCTLTAKTGTAEWGFEVGRYGRTLALGIGECFKVTDYLNPSDFTVVAQVRPRFGDGSIDLGYGTCAIWSWSPESTSGGYSMFWEESGNLLTMVRKPNAATSFTRTAVGAAITVYPGIGTTHRGMMGVAGWMSSGGWDKTSGMYIFPEESTTTTHEAASVRVPFALDFAPSGSATTTVYTAGPTKHLLLSDAGEWGGFWAYNYPREKKKVVSDLVAMEVPVNRNRKLSYTGTLAEGDAIFVDLDRYTVERWDADATTKKTNAFASITGDLPRWAECPVVFTRTALGGIQASFTPEN